MDTTLTQTCGPRKITAADKIFLAAASYLPFFCGSIITAALMKYFTDYVLLPAVMFGAAHLFNGIWTALCNIVVGGLSDNLSARGKARRLTFLRRSIPVMVVGYLLWMLASPEATDLWNTALLIVGFAVMGVGMTMFGINHASLILNITDDLDERTSIGIWNAVMILVPGLITGAVPAYFFMEGYSFDFVRLLFSGVGLAMTIISWICVSRLWEPEQTEAAQPEGTVPALTIKSLLTDFGRNLAGVFKSRSYLVFAIYMFLFTMVSVVYFSNATYYLDNVLAVTGLMATGVAIAGPVLEYAAYPVVRMFRNTLGTHKTVCLGLAVLAASYTIMYLTSGYWAFMVCYGLLHIGLAANWLLGMVMLGEIIDEDHLQHGRKRSGLFFGINGVIMVPAGSLMIFLFSSIIDYTGYDPAASQLTGLAEQGIRAGAMLIPAVISFAALVVMWFFFPLKGAYYKKVREEYHRQYGQKD